MCNVIFEATRARIEYGHENAAYLLLENRILMPDEGRFDSIADYAATLFHELSHWTQPRLDIQGTHAEKEVLAEISSSFLMASLETCGPSDPVTVPQRQ